MTEYNLIGVIADMQRKEKGSKHVRYPHTIFKVAVDLIDQRTFEKIIEEVALGKHFISLAIKTQPKEIPLSDSVPQQKIREVVKE